MLRYIFLPLFLVLAIISPAQKTAMEAWKPLLSQPGLVDYFRGCFDRLGISVIESGEKFTVHLREKEFELSSGIDSSKCDFVVRIHQSNVDNMLKHGIDNKIDEAESYKIMRVLFTPMTEAELSNPYITSERYVKMSKVERVVQITLLDPEKKNDYDHTLIFTGDQWVAVPGLYGKTKTHLRLTPAQALEFQRHLFEAKKANTKKSWISFAKWYRDWKKTVNG